MLGSEYFRSAVLRDWAFARSILIGRFDVELVEQSLEIEL